MHFRAKSMRAVRSVFNLLYSRGSILFSSIGSTMRASHAIRFTAAVAYFLSVSGLSADPWDEIRKEAERNPEKIVSCGIEGPRSVHVANAICFSLMKLSRDQFQSLKPYAAYNLLQMCGDMSSTACRAMIDQVGLLANRLKSTPPARLVPECAKNLTVAFPGKERVAYLNVCESIMTLFR